MSSPITLAQSPTIYSLAHIIGSIAFTSVVVPFLQFIPTPSCNGILPLSRCLSPQSAGGRSEGTQESHTNGRVKFNHLHTHQGSPLDPFSRALPRNLHRHPSVAQGRLHTFHPTEPRSTPYSPSIYFCHHYPSSQPALIHSLHVSKLSQYSLINSTRQLP